MLMNTQTNQSQTEARKVTPELKAAVKRMTAHCNAFQGSDLKISLMQIVNTVVPFFALLGAMYYLKSIGLYWVALLLSPIGAGLLVRLFIIQHDCGHRAFFKSTKVNDWVGRMVSLLTWMPYDFWRRAHNAHHATSGDLDRRGIGDVDVFTVKEYLEMSKFKQFVYRLYRFPLVLLVIGPPIYLIGLQRVPWGQPYVFKKVWKSLLSTNLSLFLFYGAVGSLIGFGSLLAIYAPVLVITTWIGTWMFFIQHQFEDTYWEESGEWNFHEAAILGSSHYELPSVFKWFSGNIGLHHIHHLQAKIPNYRLQECYNTSEDLKNLPHLTFKESLKCMWLTLWDESQRKLIRFKDLPKTV